jgi:myo-inositol-1(or 4)-monophosphatase
VAERGGGAFLNDRRLRVAARRELGDAVVATGMPGFGRPGRAQFAAEHAMLSDNVAAVRRSGSAALDLAWVAAGRYDGCWQRGLEPWDVAAGIIIVREAGGIVTDLSGGQGMLHNAAILAGNQHIHTALMAKLPKAD